MISAKAVRGAGWTIATGLFARVLGLVGTLLLTRFLAPEVQGEVSDAFVVTLAGTMTTTMGLPHYIVAKREVDDGVAWNITVAYVALGVFGFLVVWLLRDWAAQAFHAPALPRYIPGFVTSLMLERAGHVPERLLARQMRFREIAAIRTSSELTYSVSSIALAAGGFGGMAIVYGNVARNIVYLGMLVRAQGRAGWLQPAPMSWPILREVLAFGVPLGLGSIATFASRRCDNLLVSHMFGIGVVGLYNLAYNLADVPAIQVGEQVGEVLLPSFAQMKHEDRASALARAAGLIAMIVFPLAVGLGAVAHTFERALLSSAWYGVAPMLTVLSMLSVARPLGFTVAAYLQASNRPRASMILSFAQVALLFSCIYACGRWGPLLGGEGPVWACAGVGIAFALHAVLCMVAVGGADGVRIGKLTARLLPPLVACLPLVLAVLALRAVAVRMGWGSGLLLVGEIVVGAIGYLAGAFTLARGSARELIDTVRSAAHRRTEA